ncbi:MAG: FecR family protein [Rhodospirillales bacterium]|nr:FecR family protein [Rhodospirillales bacterium]
MMNRRSFMGKIMVTAATFLFPWTAQAQGKKGIVRQDGIIYINGVLAVVGDEVKPGDRVETGPGAKSVIVLDEDAFLLRENTQVQFPDESTAEKVLKVISGGILSVFGPKKLVLDTPVATIGIRGTGLYVRIDQGRVYACLCYGEADLRSKQNPAVQERLKTSHHDAPRYIYGQRDGNLIEKAPIEDHTDAELIMLEGLVNRVPPFGKEPLGYQFQ